MSAAEASTAPAAETKKVKLTSADNEEFAVEHEVVSCLTLLDRSLAVRAGKRQHWRLE
jgi:hypothetical protein